ncbi:lysosomal alpha-mannosidase-like [Euwallacea fornicatus]|uniref:lysosomal alpha-mannosidase-like n=1 Tax=Euwallacea fornicatus TaxID=995702 RepID=UPI00338E4651
MIVNMRILFVIGLCLSLGLSYKIKIQDVLNSCVKCHETDPDKINIHLIHHSHDDVGWLKTVDQYFFGLNKGTVNVAVENIITSVVDALWDHPDRRYIQVETAFFWKWWTHETDEMKNKFKTLVDNGQLEIINGGWSMNDEACVNYLSVIDQFTWGFKILNDTLGECGNPTFGWQIDPFGHSREHAALLWRMGFDGLMFSRLDDNDRKLRKDEGRLDFLWQTSANDDDSVIYGGITPDSLYYPPSGFCFDVLCSDDNIVDDPQEETYNAKIKAEDFANRMVDYANWYKTKNIFVTMGGDFQYQLAENNFENTDKLIKALEDHSEVKLIYSTPSCYLKALYGAEPELETKTDDFFPYSSGQHTFWTGYFSSRPNYKRLERISLNTLQVAKQLNSIVQGQGKSANADLLTYLREGIGIAQHHDSITGTAKQHVSNDYTKILAKGISQVEAEFPDLLGKALDIDLASSTEISSCLLSNMSICSTSQSAEQFVVVVYNPLSWEVDTPVRIPVEQESFTITGAEGELSYDVLDPISDFAYVQLENVKPAKKELVFVASAVPALGVKAYHIKKNSKKPVQSVTGATSNPLRFGTDDAGFEIDESSNLLKSVTLNGKTLTMKQEFLHYNSSDGPDNTDPSGAYVFRPNGEAKSFDKPSIVSKTQGNTVDEVHQKINDWITQIIRVYKGQNYIEFDWLVGPLNVSDGNGIEVISRFTVEDFKNNETFYTDSNGREMIERKLNYRPTFTYNSTVEPVTSNYYPVTSKIVIKDQEKKLQVAVLNERSQGGSSLGEGQIELMVHRRLLKDDNKGVAEPLNETEFGDQGVVARGQHYLVLGPSDEETSQGVTVTAQERILAQQKLLQPWIGIGDASNIPEDTLDKLVATKYSALKESLPKNVHLLTLEPWTGSTYIIRLEHILEKNEDSALSSEVTVDLQTLFSGFKVENIVETTLGGNRKLDSLKFRYDWSYQKGFKSAKRSLTASEVTLGPMDIKTFIVGLSKL